MHQPLACHTCYHCTFWIVMSFAWVDSQQVSAPDRRLLWICFRLSSSSKCSSIQRDQLHQPMSLNLTYCSDKSWSFLVRLNHRLVCSSLVIGLPLAPPYTAHCRNQLDLNFFGESLLYRPQSQRPQLVDLGSTDSESLHSWSMTCDQLHSSTARQ